MFRNASRLVAVLCLLILPVAAARAGDDMGARLRGALRGVTTQLREPRDEHAVRQAEHAERAEQASKVDGETQQASSRAAKNATLFKIGNEIPDRSPHMDLGDVLGAREPFTGIERVKLRNLMRDHHAKLLDQKVGP